jgi:trimeric autotransporter adhesin
VAVLKGGLVAYSYGGLVRAKHITGGDEISIAGTSDATGAGTSLATATHLSLPYGIAQALDGSILISDYYIGSVFKVDDSGIISTVLEGLQYPAGLAVDPTTGDIYVAEPGLNVILRVSAVSGVTSIFAGTPGEQCGSADITNLCNPHGVAVDPSTGDVFIADTGNHVIRRVDIKSGILSIFAGTLGVASSTGDGDAAVNATLHYPYAIAVSAAGDVYIADYYAVRRVSQSTGMITRFAGSLDGVGDTGNGGLALDATLNYPRGVAIDDSSGSVYIVDQSNHAIRRVSSTGIISTFAGAATGKVTVNTGKLAAVNSSLNRPQAVAVDTNTGAVYIADSYNNGIRVASPASGLLSTFAGILGVSAGHLPPGWGCSYQRHLLCPGSYIRRSVEWRCLHL